MNINILGIKYKIIKNANIKKYPKLKECDGYCDTSIKQIVVAKFESDDMSLENLEYYTKKVLRHELTHAFLYESGLWNNSAFGDNEELTDWIAIQFEKMLDVFIKTNALSS